MTPLTVDLIGSTKKSLHFGSLGRWGFGPEFYERISLRSLPQFATQFDLPGNGDGASQASTVAGYHFRKRWWLANLFIWGIDPG